MYFICSNNFFLKPPTNKNLFVHWMPESYCHCWVEHLVLSFLMESYNPLYGSRPYMLYQAGELVITYFHDELVRIWKDCNKVFQPILSLAGIWTADLWRTKLTCYQMSCPAWIQNSLWVANFTNYLSLKWQILTAEYWDHSEKCKYTRVVFM